MNRRRLLLLLRLVCGVLLLWWAWRQVDAPLRQVMSTIRVDGAWLLPGIVLGGLAVAGWAMRWHLFLRLCGLRQTAGETLRLTLFADFFNFYFLGPLGADGLRLVMLLRKFPDKKMRIVASIILDHASGLVGGAVMYAVFTRPQAGWLLGHEDAVPAGALIAADVLLGFVSVATIAAAVVLSESRLWNFVKRSAIGFTLTPLEPFRFLEGQRRGLIVGQLVSVPILMCTYATYWTAGMAAHQSPAFHEVMAVMPLVDVVCGLPITVSGLGVRESVFVGLLGPHLPQGNQGALVISLLGFMLTGIWGLVGGIWLGLHRIRSGPVVPAEGEAEASAG
jgi:glycosyltransferase 2 family protein